MNAARTAVTNPVPETPFPPPMPLARLLGIASGSLALAAIWSAYNAFMPLLLGAYVESRALRGAIMGLDNVLALLLIPLVGVWSDALDSRWGKRLPFVLIGVPIAAVAFAALPFAAAAAVALATLLLIDVLFLLAVTLYRAPLIALMPDHVAPERRSAANAIVTLMAAVGGVAMLLLIAPTFDRSPTIPFVAAAALALATLPIVTASALRRPPFVAVGAIAAEAPTLRSVVRDATAAFRRERANARWPLLGLFLAFFGFGAFEAQFTVVATDLFGVSGGQAGRWLGFASAAFVASALPVGIGARRFGEGRAMLLGALLLAVAVAAVAAEPLRPLALLAAGLGWALVLVPAYPRIVALGGRREVGRYTGAYYLVGSASAIVAPGLAGVAMDLFGSAALFVVSPLAFGAAAVAFAFARDRAGDHRPAPS
jgi:maltose/moltooligosaccharide transporter